MPASATPIRLHSSRRVQLDNLPPLSGYVHIPWGLRKCPYCDFNSHNLPAGGVDENAYLTALEADVAVRPACFRVRPLTGCCPACGHDCPSSPMPR